MSRGSKVYYLPSQPNAGDLTNSINTIISPEIPQKGDVCISTYVQATGAITTNISSHVDANDAYQYDGASWASMLGRETIWTDPALIANVTKIRLAHTAEMRNFSNFMQKTYARRFGDTWFNKHNMSGAVLEWYSETDVARIYIANYGTDTDYLTIECGDNVDDKIRFVNRTPANSATVTNIWDMAGNEVRSYVPGYFQMDLTAQANFYVWGTSQFTGHAQFLSTINVDGLSTLFTLLVESTSTFQQNATFQKDIIVQEAIRPSTSPSGEIDRGIEWGSTTRMIANSSTGSITIQASTSGQTVVLRVPNINSVKLNDGSTVHTVLTTGHEGHNNASGIDSDTVDGWHLSQILAQDLVFLYNGTSMRDSGLDTIGLALSVVIGGTTYYVPSWTDAGGCTCTCPCPCTCPCLCPCKSECDCWD